MVRPPLRTNCSSSIVRSCVLGTPTIVLWHHQEHHQQLLYAARAGRTAATTISILNSLALLKRRAGEKSSIASLQNVSLTRLLRGLSCTAVTGRSDKSKRPKLVSDNQGYRTRRVKLAKEGSQLVLQVSNLNDDNQLEFDHISTLSPPETVKVVPSETSFEMPPGKVTSNCP